MAFTLNLTRPNFHNGDLLQASDFNAGFVAAATIDDGQSYGFADGTAALPSVHSQSDPNTGLAWTAADSLLFIAGGVALGALTTTGFGFGTLTPDIDQIVHIKAPIAKARIESTQTGQKARLYVTSLGDALDGGSLLVLNNNSDPKTTANRFFIACNSPSGSQIGTGSAGSIQFATEMNRRFEFCTNNAPVFRIDANTVSVVSGKDFQFGSTIESYRGANKSVKVMDAAGNVIYLACYLP